MANPCCCPISYLPAALPHPRPHGTAIVCVEDWMTNLCGFTKVCGESHPSCCWSLVGLPFLSSPLLKKMACNVHAILLTEGLVCWGREEMWTGGPPSARWGRMRSGQRITSTMLILESRFLEPQVGLRHGTSENGGIPHLRENLSIPDT